MTDTELQYEAMLLLRIGQDSEDDTFWQEVLDYDKRKSNFGDSGRKSIKAQAILN